MPDSNVQSVTPIIAPLRDKVEQQAAALEENTDKTKRNIRRLGRIVLDMERMDASMKVMRADIRKDLGARRRYFRAEQKLLKKDIKQTEQLGATFLGFRSVLAAVASASAFREFSQGDIMGGVQDSALAVTAMLPEITTAVLGAVGLALGLKGGRRGPQAGPRSAAPRGRMGGRGALGLLSLIPLAMIGGSMLMGRGAGADEKRAEITQQQALESRMITPQDVNLFSATVSKFSRIVSSLLGRDVKDPTINITKDGKKKGTTTAPDDDEQPPKVTPLNSALPGANRVALNDPKREALIQLVREGEGTADAQGYNKWFGGDTSIDITNMTGNEVMQEQNRRLAAGETPTFTDSSGKVQTSAAVGAGQFMKPEQVMKAMKLDPETTKMTPEIQDEMIMYLAEQERKVNLADGISNPEMERLGMEWASLTSYHGQKNITPAESIERYNTILDDVRQRRSKPDPLGDQSSLMPNIDLPFTSKTPAPKVAAIAPAPQSPSQISIDPNSMGTTGSEIASSALLSQYNIPAMFS